MTKHSMNVARTRIDVVFVGSWLDLHRSDWWSISIIDFWGGNAMFCVIWLYVAMFRTVTSMSNEG